jgi:hypothetical protein
MPIDTNTLKQIGEHVSNNPEAYQIDQRTINRIHRHKLSRRSWKGKTTKLKEQRAKRRQKNKKPEVCRHLPSIVNMNLRSVNNKTSQLKAFQDDGDHNIICVTETWLTASNKQATLNDLSHKYTAFSNERKHDRRGGGTMVLVNKDYATNVTHLGNTNTEAAADDDDNCDVEIEMTLVKMRPSRLPRGFSALYVACVYIEPKAAASQNAAKNDEKTTIAVATRIQQAIDIDPTPQFPLIFVCGDFNTAKCTHFVRMLGVRLLNYAPTRGQRLLDSVIVWNRKKLQSSVRSSVPRPETETVTEINLKVQS